MKAKLPVFISRPWFPAVVVLTLASGMGLWFRLYPLTIQPEAKAAKISELIVHANIKKNAQKNVETNMTNLDEKKRSQLATTIFRNTLITRGDELKAKIKEKQSEIIQQQTHPKTFAPLLGADPYYYLNLTQKTLASGNYYDQRKGREYYNPQMTAPDGFWYPLDFHPYVGAALYRIFQLFDHDITVPQAVRWLAPLLAFACLFPLLFILRRTFGARWTSCAFGCVFFVLSPIFLKRSLVGWYDTDPYIIFFTLWMLVGLFQSVTGNRTFGTRVRWALFAAVGTFLYACFWRGWDIPYLITGILYSVAGLIFTRRNIPHLDTVRFYFLMAIYWLLPPLGILLLWGFTGLHQEIAHTAEFLSSFLNPSFHPWPDVFITVGELKPSDFWKCSKLIGGAVLLVVSCIGIISRFIREIKNGRDNGQKIALTVCVGMLTVAAIAAFRMERFTLMLVVPVAIAFCLFAEEMRFGLHKLLQTILVNSAQKKTIFVPGTLTIIAAVVLLIFTTANAHKTILGFPPIYNTTWDKVLKDVKKIAPENSIVSAWWPPGHFIKATTGLRVNLDGATQNEPQAYWMANLFLESDADKSLGLLRMLNTSGNRTMDKLEAFGLSLGESAALVHQVTGLDRVRAQRILSEKLPADQVNAVLELTHGREGTTPPPTYVFIYSNMVEQAMALEFIGLWDFKKAEALQKLVEEDPKRVPRALFQHGSKEHIKLLWSLSGERTMIEDPFFPTKQKDGILEFPNNTTVNIKTMDAQIESPKVGKGKPQSIFYLDHGKIVEKRFEGKTLDVCLVLFRDPNTRQYQCARMSRRMAKSFMIQLYYFRGAGIDAVKSVVDYENLFDNTRIIVFEVDWTKVK